MDGIRRSTLD